MKNNIKVQPQKQSCDFLAAGSGDGPGHAPGHTETSHGPSWCREGGGGPMGVRGGASGRTPSPLGSETHALLRGHLRQVPASRSLENQKMGIGGAGRHQEGREAVSQTARQHAPAGSAAPAASPVSSSLSPGGCVPPPVPQPSTCKESQTISTHTAAGVSTLTRTVPPGRGWGTLRPGGRVKPPCSF